MSNFREFFYAKFVKKITNIFAFIFIIIKSLVQLSISRHTCVILGHILCTFFKFSMRKTEKFENFHSSWYKSISGSCLIDLLVDVYHEKLKFPSFQFFKVSSSLFENLNKFYNMCPEVVHLWLGVKSWTRLLTMKKLNANIFAIFFVANFTSQNSHEIHTTVLWWKLLSWIF